MNNYEEKTKMCRVCLDNEFDKYPERRCTEKKVVDIRFGRYYIYDCSICGVYRLDSLAFHQLPYDETEFDVNIRAAVSHNFKLENLDKKVPSIEGNEKLFIHFKDVKLPEIEEQKKNLIRFVGEECINSIEMLPALPIDFHSIIGTVNRDSALELVRNLELEELLSVEDYEKNVRLTLKGWDKYYEDVGNLTDNRTLKYG